MQPLIIAWFFPILAHCAAWGFETRERSHLYSLRREKGIEGNFPWKKNFFDGLKPKYVWSKNKILFLKGLEEISDFRHIWNLGNTDFW